jgi:hypothetical protein
MLSTFIDHPSFTALLGGVVALILKVVYDRWFSRASRVTLEVFDEHNKLIEQRFQDMLCNCTRNQKACSDAMIAKMKINEQLIKRELNGYNVRLDDGDEIFKSQRHYQRAVILTLLQMCTKLDIDCDKLTQTFVQEDLMK